MVSERCVGDPTSGMKRVTTTSLAVPAWCSARRPAAVSLSLTSPAPGVEGLGQTVVQVTVNRWTSAPAVTGQPAQPVAGQPATYTATVAGIASDGHHPTGDVQFTFNGVPIGPRRTLDGTGRATLIASGPAGLFGVRAVDRRRPLRGQ
jgi:hypothetical protein